MSQAEFSRAYGISKRALQEWEQGGRQPDSAARAYLTVIAKAPAVVRRALASDGAREAQFKKADTPVFERQARVLRAGRRKADRVD
jgi:transcriptional regulator with XRE-family HTH domain